MEQHQEHPIECSGRCIALQNQKMLEAHPVLETISDGEGATVDYLQT